MSDFFTVKLKKIKIHSNREVLGDAEILLFSFITTDNIDMPTSIDTETLKEIASNILSSKQLYQFDHIADDSSLTFGDSGISLYTSNTIPDNINIMLVVMESDEDLRSYGKKIGTILEDESFNTLLTLISASSTVKGIAYKQIVDYIFGGISTLLKDNKNDQVDIFLTSLDRYFDYKDLIHDGVDIPGVSGNISIDYVVRGVEDVRVSSDE